MTNDLRGTDKRMIGLIPPRAYVAPGHLEREYAELFRPSWLFAGLMLEFHDGKYQGVLLGDIAVLLQCDDSGRPRAFLNVCSHRHTRLCEPGIHSGKVRCPYHSWVYNREGVPVGIPSKHAFPEVLAEPERYRLREFECEAVGPIYLRQTCVRFGRSDPEGISGRTMRISGDAPVKV